MLIISLSFAILLCVLSTQHLHSAIQMTRRAPCFESVFFHRPCPKVTLTVIDRESPQYVIQTFSTYMRMSLELFGVSDPLERKKKNILT